MIYVSFVLVTVFCCKYLEFIAYSYVVSVETVNCFKTRLDRFWLNQDIFYNFRSEIHGTGSRSEITVKASFSIKM